MTTLVCAPTPQELAALAPALLPPAEDISEMTPIKISGKRSDLLFLAAGVGPINAALAVGLTLGLTFRRGESKAGVAAILLTGLAGAYDLEKNPLTSLWQVTEEFWPEYGLNDGSSVTARAFSFPLWRRAAGDVYDSVKLAEDCSVFGYKDGPFPTRKSVTVAGVSASFARREHLYDKYRADLENMEGFAVGYAALRAGVPCVEIRSVSNKIGPRSKDEKDFDGALRTLGEILPTLNLI